MFLFDLEFVKIVFELFFEVDCIFMDDVILV